MPSNDPTNAQDSILQITAQSQFHLQKEREARRDAENSIRNFNYAKSIGRNNVDGKEEKESQPLSSVAQRYLGNLASNGDELDDNDNGHDAADQSIYDVKVQEQRIDAVSDNSGGKDEAAAEVDVANTTASVAAESSTNLMQKVDDDENRSDDMNAESDNDDEDVHAISDSSTSDDTESPSEDDYKSKSNAMLAAAAVAGDPVLASTTIDGEEDSASDPNEGDGVATDFSNSTDVCPSIPENEAVHYDHNNEETSNDGMSTTCIDGEEELYENQDEDETEYCGTVVAGALSQQTNKFSDDQSGHAIFDEESQYTDTTPQNNDTPLDQSLEREDLLNEDENFGRPNQRRQLMFILCALAATAVVVAGMGVGVNRGLNHIDNASILIIPVPTRTPTSVPSLSVPPSDFPSSSPSENPTMTPSAPPSISTMPSISPTTSMPPTLSAAPSSQPSTQPSSEPTSSPSVSSAPSDVPSASPSISTMPSAAPSTIPTSSVRASLSDFIPTLYARVLTESTLY